MLTGVRSQMASCPRQRCLAQGRLSEICQPSVGVYPATRTNAASDALAVLDATLINDFNSGPGGRAVR